MRTTAMPIQLRQLLSREWKASFLFIPLLIRVQSGPLLIKLLVPRFFANILNLWLLYIQEEERDKMIGMKMHESYDLDQG